MNLIHWFKGWFSSRNKALSFYRRGMAKAKRHDHSGAIHDYTTTIEMPETPLDVIAMAIFQSRPGSCGLGRRAARRRRPRRTFEDGFGARECQDAGPGKTCPN